MGKGKAKKQFKTMKISLFLISIIGLFALVLSCGKKSDPAPAPTPTPTPTPTALTVSTFTPATGAIGAKVVITGTGFSATLTENVVKFGGITATLDSATTTRLVTKVPKDAVTGKITVEASGKSATSSMDFSVTTVAVVISGTGATANILSNITDNGATVSSVIEKEGSNSIIQHGHVQHGHVWSSTKDTPVINGRIAATEGKTELGKVPANATFPYKFTSDLKELDAASTYNLRAYVITTQGTTYGPISQLKTDGACRLATINYSYVTDGVRTTTINRYEYNAQDLLTQETYASTTTATFNSSSSGTTDYSYDANGFLTRRQVNQKNTSNNQTTTYSAYSTYEYQNGLLTRTRAANADGTSPSTTTFEYNGAGSLIKRTVEYENRTQTIAYENSLATSYTETVKSGIAPTYVLNSKGLVTTEKRVNGTTTVEERSIYDNLDRRIQHEIYNDGVLFRYVTTEYSAETAKNALEAQPAQKGHPITKNMYGTGYFYATTKASTFYKATTTATAFTELRETYNYQRNKRGFPTSYAVSSGVFNYAYTYKNCD